MSTAGVLTSALVAGPVSAAGLVPTEGGGGRDDGLVEEIPVPIGTPVRPDGIIIGVSDGESLFDATVRYVNSNPTQADRVLIALNAAHTNAEQRLSLFPGMTVEGLRAALADTIYAVELEQATAGSGLAYLGLDQAEDQLAGSSDGGFTVGSSGGGAGSGTVTTSTWKYDRYEHYLWTDGKSTESLGDVHIYYTITLNGRQPKMYQNFNVVAVSGRSGVFQLAENEQRCRIDVSGGSDHNCAQHPVFTNGFGQARNSLRQPATGTTNFYDAEWAMKFVELQHRIGYYDSIRGWSSADWTAEHSSRRWKCQSSWFDACRFSW